MTNLDQQSQSDGPAPLLTEMRTRLQRSGLLLGAVMLLLLILFATAQITGLVALVSAFAITLLVALLPTDAETERVKAAIATGAGAAAPAIDADQAVSLMQAMPDPVAIMDGNATVTFVNRRAERVLGTDMVGASAFVRLREPSVLRAMRSAIATSTLQEVDYNHRGDIGRWYRLTVVPIEREAMAGPSSYFLIHLRDISESHRLEKMRSDFVGNASHELRTPLASLKGYLETLAGPARNDAPARERFIGIMQEQAERMERLIDDLLSLSRFETGVGQLAFGPVAMTDVLFHVRSALTPLAENIGATLIVDDEAVLELAPTVRGNRDELIQVFENLIENGIKYGGEGTQVTLRMAQLIEHGRPVICIEVEDNGPGIAQEHIPRLTERFYRVDVQSSRNKQGTGLGLAIVKHILSRHGGRLTVRSELGQGTVFVVMLPIMTEQ